MIGSIKRLFCFHPYLVKALKVSDRRVDESYWCCIKCGKVKIFKYEELPINMDIIQD